MDQLFEFISVIDDKSKLLLRNAGKHAQFVCAIKGGVEVWALADKRSRLRVRRGSTIWHNGWMYLIDEVMGMETYEYKSVEV